MTVGWVGSYVFRVANKDMTYAKQLRSYEEARGGGKEGGPFLPPRGGVFEGLRPA